MDDPRSWMGWWSAPTTAVRWSSPTPPGRPVFVVLLEGDPIRVFHRRAEADAFVSSRPIALRGARVVESYMAAADAGGSEGV